MALFIFNGVARKTSLAENGLAHISDRMLSGGGNNNVGDYFEKETVYRENLVNTGEISL